MGNRAAKVRASKQRQLAAGRSQYIDASNLDKQQLGSAARGHGQTPQAGNYPGQGVMPPGVDSARANADAALAGRGLRDPSRADFEALLFEHDIPVESLRGMDQRVFRVLLEGLVRAPCYPATTNFLFNEYCSKGPDTSAQGTINVGAFLIMVAIPSVLLFSVLGWTGYFYLLLVVALVFAAIYFLLGSLGDSLPEVCKPLCFSFTVSTHASFGDTILPQNPLTKAVIICYASVAIAITAEYFSRRQAVPA